MCETSPIREKWKTDNSIPGEQENNSDFMASREFQNFPTEHISNYKKSKAVPLHATETLGARGDKAPTHSRPQH
jgi:hypothetical protein